MDIASVDAQIGTPVPVRSVVRAETPHSTPARAARTTDVTLEQDKDSGQVVVSIVDAITKEVLVQVPPASVRATIAGLLELVRERQERR
jgi:FlaG protein